MRDGDVAIELTQISHGKQKANCNTNGGNLARSLGLVSSKVDSEKPGRDRAEKPIIKCSITTGLRENKKGICSQTLTQRRRRHCDVIRLDLQYIELF